MKISQKKFNDEAKKLKRKLHLTAPEARDELARKYGYQNYADVVELVFSKAAKKIHDTHVLFEKSDFNPEEIRRNNLIADAVINHGKQMCKKCGRSGVEVMTLPCPSTILGGKFSEP